MEKAFRKTGIDIIGDAPWGTHLCQFYETREDLVDILVPYFKAGLENNEFCMWITSEPLKVEDAKAALKKVVKNLDHFIKKGQIEILDYSEWYTKSGKFDANNVLQGWVEKENQALKRGYDGLRLSGNTFWLGKRDWRNFTDYEEEINNVIGKYRMIAICTYSLGQCGASEVIDVVSNHQFALIRREGKWVIIESSERKRAEADLQVSHRFLEIANRHKEMTPLLNEFVVEVQKFTQCAAVGIRILDEEGNIPYQAYNGFSQRFYESESPLSIKSDQCMCINVVKGVTDPKVPFYTEGGSFYMNGTTRFLATVSEEEKGQTRNVCNQVGYESVALVPIRLGDRILGLIHVADPQETMVPLERVKVLEGAAIQLGVAIQRVRAEEALRKSEGKYRTLFDGIFHGIIIADIETGQYIEVNPAVCKALGYSEEEIKALSQFKGIHPKEETERIKRLFYAQAKSEIDLAEDIPFVHKNGTIRYFDVGSVIMEVEGVRRVGGLLRDITERKQAEAERERLLADLEAKNKELEAFVYTISHDLKAPLVSLNGFSSVLQKEYESQLGEEGKHYLERIRANVAHMEALTTSLLELSRIGQVLGPIEEIDVGPLLREIRDELAVRLKEAGAEFVVQEPLPTIRADRGRIYQVFVNLIDNAVKFRSAERALRIEMGCRQESGFYRFHVADNGIGIAPQHHEKIFTPFRKLHPEIEGVGIGLALVKKIVKHHGGRVWLESEAGKGSTFYFTIPRG